jgi:hypothetical protein
MMQTPEELDAEMAARLEQREVDEEDRELELDSQGPEAAGTEHRGVMDRIKHALDFSSSAEE